MSEALPTKYLSIAGQSVFITGGATGIGATLVESFVHQGAKVTFIDLDVDSGEALAQHLREQLREQPSEQSGATIRFERVDVTDVAALKQSINDAVTAQGAIDVLVNNVANDTRHSPDDVTEASWRSCMAVNLDAAFFATQTAVASMAGETGSVINLSSINALLGPPEMPGYVAAKAGIIGLTKALARDYGERGIRVNAVLPGWVVTQRQLDTWLTPEAEAAWSEQVALKGRLMPQDVANLVLFLASADSRMITGQSLTVDAGRT